MSRRKLRALLSSLALSGLSAHAAWAQEVSTLQIAPVLGVGVHARSFERATDGGRQRLSSAFVPALEVGLTVVHQPGPDVSIAISANYQTGLGLTVDERPFLALGNEVSVRSQRLSFSVAPRWRIGAESRFGVGIGATVRSFWPSVHALQTPGYSLVGPHVRAEHEIRLVGPLHSRVTPELQWVMLLRAGMQKQTELSEQGVALGGEITLELLLSPMRRLSLRYRESHALLISLRDTERFLTLCMEDTFD